MNSGLYTKQRARLILAGIICSVLFGCADVRFERSPYAVRGVDMVYSAQENLTFIVWRLRRGIDPSLVRFELYEDGAFEPIDLQDTAFPAEPYECETSYICFQIQREGEYTFPEDVLPVRSIHEDEGLYAGTVPRVQRVSVTFSANPVALANNTRIDLGQRDWFEVNGVPLKRSYQWQLVESVGGYGERPSSLCNPAGAWSSFEPVVEVDPQWAESAKCLVLEPRREDRQGARVTVPFKPGPVLAVEEQSYVPGETRPPVLYLYLIDLLIRSPSRCEEAKRVIQTQLDRDISSRDPNARRLGSFTPLDTQTGDARDGCKQAGDQDYPIVQMLDVIKQELARYAPQKVPVVLVYMNNVELPPSQTAIDALGFLFLELEFSENGVFFTMALGSNVILELFPWNLGVPWRPINDNTFIGDLKTGIQNTVPFRTMDHDTSTLVTIRQPVEAEVRPERFKACAVTPDTIFGLVLEPGSGLFVNVNSPSYPWPRAGEPAYSIFLEDQVVVPFAEYQRQPVQFVVETCQRFCDFPFRLGNGSVAASWALEEACQWGP